MPRSQRISLLRILLSSVLCGVLPLLISCQSSAHVYNAAHDRIIDGILIEGGTLVAPGHDTARASIVVERGSGGFLIREIDSRPTFAPTDTVDATGLFIHSAHAFSLGAGVQAGSPAMLVFRKGVSPGDTAVGLLGPASGWRAIEQTENHPPGPMDERAGCYLVERGPWNDSTAASMLQRTVVPRDIRLHWQYLWHVGREQLLVATDADGRIPGTDTSFFGWAPLTVDSLRISFVADWQGTTFNVTRVGQDLVGEVRKSGHTDPGPQAIANVRLQRIDCPI
jgi:hypothetical protein